MTQKLTLALPSKGRLKEDAEALFKRIGTPVKMNGGDRGYSGTIKSIDNIDVLFLQASEITRRLIDGSVDCGITGIDLLHEYGGQDKVHVLQPLGFGYADLILAVPESWIDVQKVSDLDDVAHLFRQKNGFRFRVATKYLNLTADFFRKHAITDYRIVESQGATEGAPLNGTAEAIVDITSTGATLQANHLKILQDGVILKSEAVLASSLVADWDDEKKATLRHLLDMLCAAEEADNYRIMRGAFNYKTVKHDQIIPIIEGQGASSIVVTHSGFSCTLPKNNIYKTLKILHNLGINQLTTSPIEAVFFADNPLMNGFVEKL